MQVTGLFAGIGGIELGLNNAGHQANLFCEIWGPAKTVLEFQFPNIRIEPDVSQLASLPASTELLAAGCPCQDLSQAGLTKGIKGENSGLVEHVFRLLDKQPVGLVLLENVSFMLRLDNGSAMRRLVDAFEERGYRWAYRVIDTISFLPQRRQRVYFIASRCDIEPADVILNGDVDVEALETNLSTHAHGFYWTEGVRGLGWAKDSVPTLKKGSTIGIASPPAILLPNGEIIKPDIRDAERLQGFPENWTASIEGSYKPSLRWGLIGNAVSVPVSEWIGHQLENRQIQHGSRRC